MANEQKKIPLMYCYVIAGWYVSDIEGGRDGIIGDDVRALRYLKLKIFKNLVWHQKGSTVESKGWKATDPNWTTDWKKNMGMVIKDLKKFEDYYQTDKTWEEGGRPDLYWQARQNYFGVMTRNCFEQHLPKDIVSMKPLTIGDK